MKKNIFLYAATFLASVSIFDVTKANADLADTMKGLADNNNVKPAKEENAGAEPITANNPTADDKKDAESKPEKKVDEDKSAEVKPEDTQEKVILSKIDAKADEVKPSFDDVSAENKKMNEDAIDNIVKTGTFIIDFSGKSIDDSTLDHFVYTLKNVLNSIKTMKPVDPSINTPQKLLLNFSYNKITASGWYRLLVFINEYPDVVVNINLAYNKMGNSIVNSIKNAVESGMDPMLKIRSIDFRGNEINNGGAETLAEILKNMPAMTRIDLGDNRISNPTPIIDAIKSLPEGSLRSIVMFDNLIPPHLIDSYIKATDKIIFKTKEAASIIPVAPAPAAIATTPEMGTSVSNLALQQAQKAAQLQAQQMALKQVQEAAQLQAQQMALQQAQEAAQLQAQQAPAQQQMPGVQQQVQQAQEAAQLQAQQAPAQQQMPGVQQQAQEAAQLQVQQAPAQQQMPGVQQQQQAQQAPAQQQMPGVQQQAQQTPAQQQMPGA